MIFGWNSDQLSALLREFEEDFDKIFQQALRATFNVLPVQASNEIRNFVGHLATSILTPEGDRARVELERARRHLRYATYDALAITLLYRIAYLEAYLANIEHTSQNLLQLRSRLAELIELRRGAPQIPDDPVQRTEDDDLEAAMERIERATDANEYLEKAITRSNQFAEELERDFVAGTPDERDVLKYLAPPGAEAHALPSSVETRRQKKGRIIRAMWAYAGGLCLLLSGIQYAALGSTVLLIPIIGICAGCALIGTFIVATEPPRGLLFSETSR